MRPVWTLDEILVPAAQMISAMTVVIGVVWLRRVGICAMAMVQARRLALGGQTG